MDSNPTPGCLLCGPYGHGLATSPHRRRRQAPCAAQRHSACHPGLCIHGVWKRKWV